jgi:hypothetical protein
MRDRILRLLRQKNRPLPADQVLSEALGVHSPSTATADKVLKAILRWLSANKSRINFVDVDEAGSCETIIQRLSAYLQDRDRLTRKIFYR